MLYIPAFWDDFYDECKANDVEFSDDAIDALYEYYDELEEHIELDIVKIKNTWTEYDTFHDAMIAIVLQNNMNIDMKNYSEDDCRKFIEGSDNPYNYLICENNHVLLENGIW